MAAELLARRCMNVCVHFAILRRSHSAALSLTILLYTTSRVSYMQFGIRFVKVPAGQGEAMLRGTLGLSHESGDKRIVRALFSSSSVSFHFLKIYSPLGRSVHEKRGLYSPDGVAPGNTDLPASHALVNGKYLLEHAQTCWPSMFACLMPPLPQVELMFGPGHWPESLQPGSSVRSIKMLTSGTLSLAACAKRNAIEGSSQFHIPPSVAPISAIAAFWRSTTVFTTFL